MSTFNMAGFSKAVNHDMVQFQNVHFLSVCVCGCVGACLCACMCMCACAHDITTHNITNCWISENTDTDTQQTQRQSKPKWSHYTCRHVPEHITKSTMVVGKTTGCRAARKAGKLTHQADEDVGNWLTTLMKMLGTDSPSWWRFLRLTHQADEDVGTDSPSWWRSWELTHQAD